MSSDRYALIKQKMIEKLGGEAKYKEYMAKLGSKGGKNSTNRPFRDVPGLASKAGKISAPIRRKNKK